jgi:carbonic anhydrase/acetyltransferase-like protein (isoleucine patch superfamily)
MIFELGNKRLTGDGKYWIAPSANVIGDVTLKNDSSIWFNVVIRGDIENITVGEGSNVQDNSVLHTDYGVPLKIGKMVTIGHLVMLHGCTIMDNSFDWHRLNNFK